MTFREDINGLRAIAVLLVVFFHFGFDIFQGGFIGVDIFFVISGYLMTRIILSKLDNHTFSIIGFYTDRGKRIIPALAFLCLCIFVLGWFVVLPNDYEKIGKHVAVSVTFLSNIFYWFEANYFNSESHGNWLLHTWSLSVEWQFYIIYPVILVLANKVLSRSGFKLLILAAVVFSLLISIGFSDKYPTASFYLLHTRAWELLAGALVYLYPVSLSSFRGKLIELAGLLLIVICVFSYTTEEIWPGYLAIFPVFGTAMIMLAARSDSIFTNNFIFNWLGKTSYSIYLYHWPVVVLLNYFELIPSGVWIFVGLALSVVLGALSYYLIENKFKYLNRAFVGVNTNSNKRSGVLLCVIVSSLGAIGAAVQHSDGFEARFDKKILIAAAEADNRSLKTKMCLSSPKSSSDHEGCVLGNHQKIKAIIIGDSHANSLATALISSLMDNNAGVLVLARHSCPFILGAKNRNYAIYNCTQANARNIDILQNQYVGIPIFVVNRASGYLYGQTNPRRFQGLSPAIYFDKKYTIVESGLLNDFSRQYEKTACQLAEQNPVFITEPIPEMRLNVPNTMSRRAALSGDLQDIKIDKKLYLERNQFIKKLNRQVQDKCAITVLDTAEYLCDEKFCFGSLDGRPLYSDGDHLSENGNKLLIPMFQEAIEKTPSN